MLDIIQVYADNLRSVYDRASRADKRHGRQWYGIARYECYKIAREHGHSLKRTVFATAVLSNQIDWEQNVDLAFHVAFCARHGMEPRGHYKALLDKALRIFKGDFDALRGPKVIPFAAAIYNVHSNAAVIDRWMWRAVGGVGELTEKRLRDSAVALRRVARALRKPVSDVQAVIWLTVRREASE